MTSPSFRDLVHEYLDLRRGLGFELESPGWLLLDFARHADRIGHQGPLTIDLAVDWALCSRSADPAQAARRLAALRQFARHRAVMDPETEIPPRGHLGRLPRRKQPHIYSDAELAALLRQASLLRPHRGLRPKTYVAFFSLLVSTGLRLSETCRLTTRDVDLDDGILTVRESKFRKSRLVPLHSSATEALTRYAAHRDRCRNAPRSQRFFRTDRAPALERAAVQKTFSRLRDRLGWTAQGRVRRPRIHDLRHTFAVRRLLRWHEEGADGHHLAALRALRPAKPGGRHIVTPPEIDFPALLHDFFLRRLVNERGASAHTVASYRDTFELLLRYVEQHTGRTPSALKLEDLDAPMILAFLDHLEAERGNSPRTRNLRLTAIRSFLRYASMRDPTSLPIAQRVLAISPKRYDRPALDYLTREEVDALLDAPDRATWSGQRDAVLFAVLYNTGARVSEVIGLRITDVLLDRESALHLRGKGRKERVVPLWKSTAALLRSWLPRIDAGPGAPVFPNRSGQRLSRSGVEYRLRAALRRAAERCPSLASRRISPHTLRHTTAMHLLQSGVDITVIALWLGHEDTTTTHLYVEADLAMKEAALRRVHDPAPKPVRFTARDRLLAFLEAL